VKRGNFSQLPTKSVFSGNSHSLLREKCLISFDMKLGKTSGENLSPPYSEIWEIPSVVTPGKRYPPKCKIKGIPKYLWASRK